MPDDVTPNLGLPLMAEGQAQPHVPYNEAMTILDGGGGGGGSGGASWPTSPGGVSLRLGVAEADLTLAGASTTASGLIPTRAIVVGVLSETLVAITGAASYQVGTVAGASEFGGSLGLAVGSRNAGVVGPVATYSPGNVVVSAVGGGGAFTGGKVRVTVCYILPAFPS
jgi:hypothetical protein